MPISTITANSVANNSLTTDQFASTAVHGQRNLIINGAMQVAQRGTSTSSVSSSGYFACDRQKYYRAAAIDQTVVTVSQSTDAPTGFGYSHKVQVTTAETSIDSDDLICPLHYLIESQNLKHLGYSTSSAKTMTLSFWVKSNVTGVFTISLYNGGANRLIAPTYTVSSADTWEYKTITIPGDLTGSIPNNSTQSGIDLYFNAMVGSSFTSGTSAENAWAAYSGSGVWCVGHTAVWGSSTSDYWQITGVQLEVGDTATPFEHRSYGDELARCQRYYQKVDYWASNGGIADSWYYSNVGFLTAMRASPSLVSATAYGLDTGNAFTRQSNVNINGWQMAGSTTTAASVYSINNSIWQQIVGRGHFDAEL